MIKYIVTDGAYKILSANIFDCRLMPSTLPTGMLPRTRGRLFAFGKSPQSGRTLAQQTLIPRGPRRHRSLWRSALLSKQL